MPSRDRSCLKSKLMIRDVMKLNYFGDINHLLVDRTMIKTVLKNLIANLHIFNPNNKQFRMKNFLINFEFQRLFYYIITDTLKIKSKENGRFLSNKLVNIIEEKTISISEN